MSTYREIVYMCLEELRLYSDDSYFTEDHIAFLADKYRAALLAQKYAKEFHIDDDNYSEICLDLEKVFGASGIRCDDVYLRSTIKFPATIDIGIKRVYAEDYFSSEHIAWIKPERMRFVGRNKWLADMIYVCEGPDKRLYLRSANPQMQYLKSVRVSAVFANPKDIAEYACECSDKPCDWLDADFPLEEELIVNLIGYVVKELSAVKHLPTDKENNAADDLALIGMAAASSSSGSSNSKSESETQ